jgi:RNA polymerase sigma-70 factor (ECF subfamily)
MFEVPFDQLAHMMDRSPEAVRQLASRGRRRVQGVPAVPDSDLTRQRAVVDAFFTAARGGDFEALTSLLHPDVVVRSDGGTERPALSRVLRGAQVVARSAITFAQPNSVVRPTLVNGAAGALIYQEGEPTVIMAFTVSEGRILEIDAINDPARIRQLVREL